MAAATPVLRIEPLSDQHDRENFASGVEPLDSYLRHQAGQNARRRVASCFVLVSDGDLTHLRQPASLLRIIRAAGEAAATLFGRDRNADGTAGG